LLDQAGELCVSEQGRDHGVDIVDRPLREVPLPVGSQLVEQVDQMARADVRQRQITDLGQDVMPEPALIVAPVELSLLALDDPAGREHAHGAHGGDVLRARFGRARRVLHVLRLLARGNTRHDLGMNLAGKCLLPYHVARKRVAPMSRKRIHSFSPRA
jgi:hypothetical protein